MSDDSRLQALRIAAQQFISNKITIGFLSLAAVYWAVASFIQPEWRDAMILFMRSAVTFGLLLTAGTYFESAPRSLARGEDGSVAQWLTGMVVFCVSMAGSSVYTMVWIYADRPIWMTNHPLLGFILMWQVVGVSLLIKAPGADGPTTGFRSRLLIALAFVAAIVAAFAVGRITKTPTAMANPISLTSPYCSPDRPIWGNINSRGVRIFHSPDSPYRGMVVPDECFSTEEEAREAGYRAPG